MVLEEGLTAICLKSYILLIRRILFGKTASLNAVDAINRLNVPVLIVHGTRDEMVAYEVSSIISNIDEITNPMLEQYRWMNPGAGPRYK